MVQVVLEGTGQKGKQNSNLRFFLGKEVKS